MRRSIPCIVLCAVLALAGCGDSGSSSGEKPKAVVAVPKGPPPKKLVIKELEKGTGKATVKAGDRATVRWHGILYKSGKEFYSPSKTDGPFTFQVNVGQVIRGWDLGMRGMRAGGTRELIIPPSLAYGSEGSTYVPPNETLIYVVHLLAIK
jgi:FKBP-type peptidyl-prolyl cis-trans isomerase